MTRRGRDLTAAEIEALANRADAGFDLTEWMPRRWRADVDEGSTARWDQLTLIEQLANIGSEFSRAARAKTSNNEARFVAALDRCLGLFDLTLADERWRGRRREIARTREVVCDFLVGDNQFGSTAEGLDAYFLAFARAARNHAS